MALFGFRCPWVLILVVIIASLCMDTSLTNAQGLPNVTVRDNNKVSVEGSTVVLQCEFESNPSPDDVFWTKDNSRIDTANQPNKYRDGTILVPSLTIIIVESSDRGDYRCIVGNALGTAVSAPINLDVLYKPIITLFTRFVSVDVGIQTTLNCIVDSNPEPSSIYWSFFGERIDPTTNRNKFSGGTVSEPRLTLVNLNAFDSGLYTIVVTNVIGTTTSMAIDVRVKTEITNRPVITWFTANGTTNPQTIRQGELMNVVCEAQSDPAPTVSIKNNRNGVRYPARSTLIGDYVVQIEATVPSEDCPSMDLTCEAENAPNSRDDRTMTLSVECRDDQQPTTDYPLESTTYVWHKNATTTNTNGVCPYQVGFLYPHPDSCSGKFQSCDRGVFYTHSCRGDKVFSKLVGACVKPGSPLDTCSP